GRDAGATVGRRAAPAGVTQRTVRRWPGVYGRRIVRGSAAEPTGRPPSAVILSPAVMPAAAAGPPVVTPATSAPSGDRLSTSTPSSGPGPMWMFADPPPPASICRTTAIALLMATAKPAPGRVLTRPFCDPAVVMPMTLPALSMT